jgi:hypothetical protein
VNISQQFEKKEEPTRKQGGISWGVMIAIVAFAILAAGFIAYLLVNPYFHQHAP